MRNISNLISLLALVLMLSLSLSVSAQNPEPMPSPPNPSVSSSPPSVTPASDLTGLIKACGEAVEELKASRTAIQRQKAEIVLQAELLKLEKEISIGLRDIRTLDEKEKILLRQAIAASQDANLALKEQNLALKKQKFTLWKGIKAVTLGVAAGIVLGAVLSR